MPGLPQFAPEILDEIFRNIYQDPRPLQRLIFPPKTAIQDLQACRLVCKIFSDVGTRWIWRSLRLRFVELSQGNRVCEHLKSHPDAADSVRYLHLLVVSRDYLDVRGFNDDSNLGYSSLVDILSAEKPALNNLRYLGLSVDFSINLALPPSAFAFTAAMKLMNALHTVALTKVDCSRLGVNCPVFNHVKRLDLSNCSNIDAISSVMPSLEVYRVYFEEQDNPEISRLPWKTLRELTVETNGGLSWCGEVVADFKEWNKKISNAGSSPLTELIFFEDSGFDIEAVLEAFSEVHLKKLFLAYTGCMTVDLFKEIVGTFPGLEDLTIVDGSEPDTMWEEPIVEYAKVLGQHTNLKGFTCDYVDLGPQSENLTPTQDYHLADVDGFEELRHEKNTVDSSNELDHDVRHLADYALCLRRHCSQLRRIGFRDINSSGGKIAGLEVLQFEVTDDPEQGTQHGDGRLRFLGELEWDYKSSYWSKTVEI